MLFRSDALRLDESLRGNRVANPDAEIGRLCEESPSFAHLMGLARGDFEQSDALIGALESKVQASTNRASAWRAEQLVALKLLRRFFAVAQQAGVGIAVCADMLGRASVAVSTRSRAAEEQGNPPATVLVTTQRAAATLPPASCDVVLLADLTAEDYPIAERDDAVATLFSALGLLPEETALEGARREFEALLGLSAHSIVLCRPLGDDNADETYPAVMLEELVDAYRDDPSDASEVDNAYRLPPLLQRGLAERGEELLFANARASEREAVQPVAAQIPPPFLDEVPEGLRAEVAPRRFNSAGNRIRGLCPSPSQVEVYLECPFKWFASRRLRIGELDEGFGPLEKGSFAHAALETFYRRFQEEGHAKVTEQTLERARELMRDVAAELAQRQYEMEPGDGRLVASNELERREVAALCEQLVGFLDTEAQLLPTFHPAYLEYEIDADHPVEYAGHHVVGTVDRIDVDAAGHAVIVDYKGSLNSEYEIGGKVEGRCGKVQTRMYAQAVKRALGLDVVAALYVSYGRKPGVSGAYDPRVVDAAHLPGVKADRCSCGQLGSVPLLPADDYSLGSLAFDVMLDETEAIVARALQEMEQGFVAPRPSHPDVCTYCPVAVCPKRGE